MKIYLAHPISGLSADEIFEYYEKMNHVLRRDYEVLYPMLGKGYLRNEIKLKAGGYNNPVSTNHAIKERDKWMVMTSDIVFVDLTGAKDHSVGCIAELAWADMAQKHTIVVLDKDGFHNHAFILDCADIVFETNEEALKYLEELANQKDPYEEKFELQKLCET